MPINEFINELVLSYSHITLSVYPTSIKNRKSSGIDKAAITIIEHDTPNRKVKKENIGGQRKVIAIPQRSMLPQKSRTRIYITAKI
jgi:hypothetical protein